jgi:hypothetical protein
MEYALLFSFMGTWIVWLYWRYIGLYREHTKAVKIISIFMAEKMEAELGDILEFEIVRKKNPQVRLEESKNRRVICNTKHH